MKINYFNIVLFGAVILISFNASAQHDSKPGKKTVFIDKSNMDLSSKPGNDFYNYASGTWIKNNPVPAKETRWGSFNQLRDFNINAVKTILNEAANNKSATPGSVEKRIGDFYTAGMDSVSIEKLGYTPIKDDLEKINSISSLSEVITQAALMRTYGGGSPLFGFYVGQDRKYVKNIVPQLSQGGTTLPDRDYYLKTDARNLKIQEAYKTYITKLFTLSGRSQEEAEKNAEIIFNFEKTLAAAQISRVEMRDPYKTYNKFSVADFSKTTPNLNWQALLPAMKVNGQDTLLVNYPRFFTELNSLLGTTAVNDLKTYLQWNVLKNSAPYLNSAFVNANFTFSQALTGQKVPTPRWQRMSLLTDGSVGELLGQLYVKKHFKPEAKLRMQELVSNLIKAYEIRIKNLDWMSDVTKQKALDKLHAFTPKIAYPDKWKTYEGLEINKKSFFKNLRNAGTWGYADMIDQLGKPVDKSRWGMTAPTVNAYYNPVNNEIVFPAGILQFPFFDIHVNGKLTLGENIGDLGGLNAAYEAFKMTKQGQSNEKIDGFTPDQRFFLSWAQVWKGNVLSETAAQLIVTDPHSPGPYRTIGAPVNMDAWYEAFDVKPGDKLYKKPEYRIKIW